MSSPARLIFLSGTGGSGTSTIAAATLQALADEGLSAVLIDVEDARDPSPQAISLIASTAGALAGWTGAGPIEPETWSDLPTVRHLDTWLTICAARDAGVDAIVVDCGDLRQSRDLLAFPLVATRIVDRVLTPTVAMRREPVDPVGGQPDSGPRGFETLSDLRTFLTEAVAGMTGHGASMRLVCSPTGDSVERTVHAVAVMSLLGVDVEGIVMARVARKGDGATADVIEAQAGLLAQLERAVTGPLVWKSSSRIRPMPKGRSAMGPLGASRTLRSEEVETRAHDEEYSLSIPLMGAARSRSRVGRLGDDLVVSFDGLHRWIALPSVLRRCRALSATRTADGLRISFVPDASLWRSPSPSEEGAA